MQDREMRDSLDERRTGRVYRDEDGFRNVLVDFREEESCFLIAVELPGMEKEDIEIELREDAIVIRAEKKKQQKKEDEGTYSYSASYAGFSRVIQLPENVDSEKVEAEYKNGVLKIRVGKKSGRVIRIR